MVGSALDLVFPNSIIMSCFFSVGLTEGKTHHTRHEFINHRSMIMLFPFVENGQDGAGVSVSVLGSPQFYLFYNDSDILLKDH